MVVTYTPSASRSPLLSSSSAMLLGASPANMFPAPPLPVECLAGEMAWRVGSRERERLMFPRPPRPEEC